MDTGRADLHIHTIASDGALTSTRVVEEAKRVGLAAVAISDHDTVDGIAEALDAGKRLGITVVPAVEINTDMGPLEIHIMGYFMDWQSEKFAKHLERLRNARLERCKKIVEKLKALGIPIKLDRVLEIAGSGSVGRPHVAQALVECGAVETMGMAFVKYLVRGMPGFVERMKMSPLEAVTIVVDAGGVAGFAHPGQVGRDDLIPNLVKNGLGAIEVRYTGQIPEVVRYYEGVAKKFDLIPTGGSDAHGINADGTTAIGTVTVDIGVVDLLRERSSYSNS